MTPWTKASTSDKGRRVTIEDASGYLVSVSSPCPTLSWAEAWKRYEAVSDGREKVAG